jgi:imidazole glycerol phosphate synthase subunit HisF
MLWLLKDLKQVDITEGRNNYYDLDSHGKEQLTIPVIAAGGIGTVAECQRLWFWC